MNTNLPGIERQAQHRSSWSSDFFGGGQPAQPPFPSDSSEPIPINVQPPVRPRCAVAHGPMFILFLYLVSGIIRVISSSRDAIAGKQVV